MNFQLDILSIKGSIYSGEVRQVTLPSISGEMTVLARHMPIVSPLDVGEVIVTTPDNKQLSFAIGKGVFAIKENKATLLIEDVTAADDVSEQNALEAKKKAEELLAKGIKGEEKLRAIYQLRRSLVDLKLVRRKKKVIL